MNAKISPQEKGQSLVLIAVLIIFFFGLLGLALDGGNAYAMKRAAQNAADSGALAGATTLCNSEDTRDPKTVAESYAIQHNRATEANAIVASKTVTVTAGISYSTFFLNFFGKSTMTARAIAAAGCFPPGYGDGVLPIAWNCRPPTGGPSDSNKCEEQRINWTTLQSYLATPNTWHPELYIIMDSESYQNDFYCMETNPAGTLKCDLDNDGEIDWLATGGRSWLDLDGQSGLNPGYDCNVIANSEGESELVEWIEKGFPCSMVPHSWLVEQTGVSNATFSSVERRRQTNPLVIIPVFDAFCDGDPRNTAGCIWHSGNPQDVIRAVSAASPVYFHIVDFSAFYITCVRQNPQDSCIGYDTMVANNLPANQWVNTKTIEGYFIEGVIPGLGGIGTGGDLDLGVYTVYLYR
jgi:hypothetical protein